MLSRSRALPLVVLSYLAFGILVILASGAGVANDIGGLIGVVFLVYVVVLGCLTDSSAG